MAQGYYTHRVVIWRLREQKQFPAIIQRSSDSPTVQLIIPAAAFITYVTNDEYNQNKNKLKPRVHCFLNIARLCTSEQDNLYIELPYSVCYIDLHYPVFNYKLYYNILHNL